MALSALVLILAALMLGAFSSALFLWQWLVGAPGPIVASILLVALAAGFVGVLLYFQRRIPKPQPVGTRWAVRLVPAACMLAAFGYAGASFVEHVQTLSLGGWDAYAEWTLHARFLYRGSSGAWRAMFDPALYGTNADYPLLVPGLVSGVWTAGGAERWWIPGLVGAIFAALAVGILCCAASAVGNDERGWLAGLLLLATPRFLQHAAAQVADVPISVYLLATVALLAFAELWPNLRRPIWILAGFSAGLAAWTKNEGSLFVMAVLASQVVSYSVFRRWRELRTALMMMSIGLAPMAGLLAAFKILLGAGRTPIQAIQKIASVHHAASVARYGEVASGFLDQLKGFGGTYGSLGIHPLVLVALFSILYVGPIKKVAPASVSMVLVIAFMIGAYFMVYLVSPYSVAEYIANSLDRLYLQIWPVSLLVIATFPALTRGVSNG